MHHHNQAVSNFNHYTTAQPSFSYPSTSFGHYTPHYSAPSGGGGTTSHSFPPNHTYNQGKFHLVMHYFYVKLNFFFFFFFHRFTERTSPNGTRFQRIFWCSCNWFLPQPDVGSSRHVWSQHQFVSNEWWTDELGSQHDWVPVLLWSVSFKCHWIPLLLSAERRSGCRIPSNA